MTDSKKDKDLGAEQSRLHRAQMDGGASVSEEELRHLVEASHDLLAITNFDGYFELLSPSWEAALGYTRDELRARQYIEFVHPEDRSKTDIVESRIRPGVDLLSFHNRYIAKDGSVRNMNWRAIVSAERKRYYTSTREMTDALQRNQALDALDALCDLLPVAVVAQSAEGLITRWDAEAQNWFGWSAAEVIGTPARGLFLDSQGNAADLLTLGAEDGNEIEASLRTPSGTASVLIRRNAFGDGSTAVTGAIATVSRR